ncbi:hypothetical protein [Coleofasciculus sp. H7-2]|uniref:hypothetical protein n=1 Tax=Coleofasciculus sp. H7-2 TaxID=3351545 RepID=UPI00366F52F8
MSAQFLEDRRGELILNEEQSAAFTHSWQQKKKNLLAVIPYLVLVLGWIFADSTPDPSSSQTSPYTT